MFVHELSISNAKNVNASEQQRYHKTRAPSTNNNLDALQSSMISICIHVICNTILWCAFCKKRTVIELECSSYAVHSAV
jgi:hypothetical protein